MKTELEPEDIELITARIVERLKPRLLNVDRGQKEDTVFDVSGLCKYLKVTPKWVYEQTHMKTIPHFKLSNKVLRFRQSAIDEWIEKLKIPAVKDPGCKFKVAR